MAKNKILYISSTASGMHSSSIYNDLMHSLIEAGNEVYCAYALEKRFKKETKTYSQDGINYLGIKIGNITKNKNLISKGIATLTIDGLYLKAIKKYYSTIDFDMVLYSTPPITFVKTVQYFKDKNVFTYLMLKDIFPQNAFDLGLIKPNGFIGKMFKNKETQVYKSSDYIGVMSSENKNYLLKQNPEVEGKVEVLSNSINISLQQDEPDLNRENFGLDDDKLLLLYGGNLGKPQGIDYIESCIKELEKIEDVQLAICGGGAMTDRLLNFLNMNDIKNTIYIGSLPVEQYNKVTELCDVGLIFLDYRFTIPNFPQRLLSYMKASKPILCATDPNTDVGTITQDNGFGISVLSNNVEDWIKSVVKLRDDSKLRIKMGEKAHSYLVENYDVKIATNTILKHLRKKDNHV